MRITLNYQEIREALVKAVEEKTQHIFGEISQDDCYFCNEDYDFTDLEFVCSVEELER